MGKTYAGNTSDESVIPKKIYAGDASNHSVPCKVAYCGDSNGKSVEVWRNSTLPTAYQKVQYIFNSGGTQYINTGVIANSDTKTLLECEFSSISSLWSRHFFGIKYITNSGSKSYALEIQNGGANVNAYFGSATLKNNNSVAENTRYIFLLNESGGKFYKNDSLLGSTTVTFSSPSENLPLLLFGFYNKYYAQEASLGIATQGLRLYHFQVWQSGTMIRNMYPCYLKSDSQTVGMYDLIGGQFYGNSGTGIFYKGPNVN